jgi:D-alanyl-lipoteichoic acid acyltransferase DltB (MBOAT superfamily)
MSNNYSALAFWRAWHRSFNRWIVRYIFVPLGGSGAKSSDQGSSILGYLINSLAVFSFVAIWHDISLTLLTWGWLVVIFLIPEMLATQLTKPLRKEWYYRHICAVGAVGNILMMMAANLVGFCVGLDGLRDMISEIFGSVSGFAFLGIACSALFVGVQVMFEVRQDELTRGIDLRC